MAETTLKGEFSGLNGVFERRLHIDNFFKNCLGFFSSEGLFGHTPDDKYFICEITSILSRTPPRGGWAALQRRNSAWCAR